VKLKNFADTLGISYGTALRMMKAGQIPGAFRLPSGTIIVPDDSIETLAKLGSDEVSLKEFLLCMKVFADKSLSEDDKKTMERIIAAVEGLV
tara:strand:- start:68 stop:343 length:276 start_codon:yes stop_codon:yes gene_type:complete